MIQHRYADIAIDTDYSSVGDNLDCIKDTASICIFQSINKDVKYTITIPTYKRIDLLKEAIESALNQIDAPLYNIVVLDNNPERNDSTELFMSQYKGTIISYFKNVENLGMGGNWNRCAQLSQGQFFVLLHDDDKILSTFLHEVEKVISKFPNLALVQTMKYSDGSPNITNNYINKLSFLQMVQGSGIFGAPTGIVYCKEKYLHMGGIAYDQYESFGYWFNCLLVRDYPCFFVNKELTYYRIGENNESNNSIIHPTWIRYNYGLLRYIMRKCNIPKFIYAPYLQFFCNKMADDIKKRWHSNFVFPNEIDRSKYSKSRCLLAFKIINKLIGITSKRILIE